MPSKKPASPITPERIRALPAQPGVYIMRGEDGETLYIGKAKDLRSRVRSYFNGSDERSTVPFLLEQAIHIETLVTEDERQALILEADLIRKHRPHYNIRLKDDKAPLLVRIDESQEWPRIELVRKTKDDGAHYIGPFTFSYEIRALLESMQRVVPLRSCTDRVLYNRVRPCLEYQIKRCCAPCCHPVDPTYYRGLVSQAIAIVQGEVDQVVQRLGEDRDRASEELRFEDAAEYRDRIELLLRIQNERAERIYGSDSHDVFGLYREGRNAELCVVLVRDGRLYESKSFGFSNVQIPDDELLASVLTQYYEREQAPVASILVPIALDDLAAREALLQERRGRSVKIVQPQRGSKRRLLELALTNAKQNFEGRFSEIDRQERILEALREECKLEGAPRVIECMDVSHFQGGSTVGAIVCFKDLKPERSRYRVLHLSQEQPDDFASMFEMVTRHLSRQAEENTLADLLVIDGGAAQLEQALKARAKVGVVQPQIISLAKKRLATAQYRSLAPARRKPERVFLEGVAEPIVLDPRSEVLQFLERLRDETHRSAVQFHRKTRKKQTFTSALDAIPGIGPKRRLSLLREFGSVAAIRAASVEELITRAKLPKSLAERLYRQLHPSESK